MSSIYGFDINSSVNLQYILEHLSNLNAFYGVEVNSICIDSRRGIGVCADSYSFSSSRSIHENSCVIDALIYNRTELLNDLNISESVSDSELIFLLIKKYGMSILAKVNGDFAGAWYESGKWYLFRDHLGVRPLFYYFKSGSLVFSTDLRAISTLCIVDTEIDETKNFLNWSGHISLDLVRTEFKYINCVRPGSWIEVSDLVEEHVYWKPGQKKVRLSDINSYAFEMKRLVNDAIKIRAERVGDSIGSELSGGLDSSVISIMLKRFGYDIKCASWSKDLSEVPLQEVDERKVIADICIHEGLDCTFVNESRMLIKNSVAISVPPYANTWIISDTAKYLHSKGIKAVFTGQGGDEVVSHRAHVLELWHTKEYKHFLSEVYLTTKGKRFRLLRTIKRSFNLIKNVYPYYFVSWWNKTADASSCMTDSFLSRMKSVDCPMHLFGIDPAHYIEHGGERHRLDNLAFQGAEQGIRYLIPYLDYRVVDFSLGIPRWLFHHDGKERYIFFEAYKDIMPESLKQVDYKDYASMRGYDYSKIEQIYEEDKKNIAKLIDADRWNKYWDIDKVKRILVNYRDDEKDLSDALYDYMYQCILIQNSESKDK